MTLEGEAVSGTGVSNADKITDVIYKNSLVENATSPNDYDTSYGEKFFFVYVNSSNSASKEAESGFKYLRDYWNKTGIYSDDDLPFTYYAIFSDDTSENDDDIDSSLGDAWERYLKNNIDFFNSSIQLLEDSPYYYNSSASEDNYLNFALSDLASDKEASSVFPVPSFCLVDYSQKAIDQNRAGLSEVIFSSISGDTDAAKAKVLMNMWNHTSSDSTNIFSSSYVK